MMKLLQVLLAVLCAALLSTAKLAPAVNPVHEPIPAEERIIPSDMETEPGEI